MIHLHQGGLPRLARLRLTPGRMVAAAPQKTGRQRNGVSLREQAKRVDTPRIIWFSSIGHVVSR